MVSLCSCSVKLIRTMLLGASDMARSSNEKSLLRGEEMLRDWPHRVQQVWVNWIVVFSLLLFVARINLVPGISFGGGIAPVVTLKEMFLDTVLVHSGRAEVVIVTPEGKYAQAVARIRNWIKDISGTDVEIVSAEDVSLSLLQERNVIVCGNMADNAFIKQLYVKYYTLVDLVYPGKGGHVLRTLHNPLGTGHNVILVGGSDNEGVDVAALHLESLIEAGNPLSVGRIMDIELGADTIAPEYEADSTEQTVYSWRDSYRTISTGKGFGYAPATFFGWNAISIAGMLYYMTGDASYLNTFKKLAFPQVGGPSARVMNDSAFQDTNNPLVKNDHYRSHLLDIVWDLIEESPGFSDQERLYITNKLLERQLYYDPENSYSYHTDRHNLWHLMNIYTGSRYFNSYYPDAFWGKRLNNVRQAFSTFINDPRWSVRDTLYFVPTSVEPILEFFILDGSEEFVNSGTAKQMMQALDILYSGQNVDDCNRFTSLSLLHKAAWLLNEPRYAWMAKRFGYDFDVFRIGQSYWPPYTDVPEPTELIGILQSYPLAQTDWENYGNTVPGDQAFQILSYRSGLEADDDYFLVDGFAGMGRNPYHLGAIKELRLFGTTVLSGYENDVDISVDGLVEPKVARAAALKKAFTSGGVSYLQLEVPNMPGATWKRHLLFVDGEFALVADDIKARRKGMFDISIGWRFGAKSNFDKPTNEIRLADSAVLQTTWEQYLSDGDYAAYQKAHVSLDAGQQVSAFSRIGSFDDAGTIFSPAPQTLVAGTEGSQQKAYVKVGPENTDGLVIDASFTYVDCKRVCLVEATQFSYKKESLFSSQVPWTGCWQLESGQDTFKASIASARLAGVAEGGQNDGEVSGPVSSAISAFLDDIARIDPQDNEEEKKSPTIISISLNDADISIPEVHGSVTAITSAPFDEVTAAYVATDVEEGAELYLLSDKGSTKLIADLPCKVLSLLAAGSQEQKKNFAFLVGCDDDTLRAYDGTGKQLWSVTTLPDESYIVGSRYDAPWFTNPNPPDNKKGVRAILVGNFLQSGGECIAIGRPSTVAFYSLPGKYLCSVPIHWGDVVDLEYISGVGNPPRQLLLAAKYLAGHPYLSGIDDTCTNISNRYFSQLSAGYENMHAWLQRGTTDLVVDDLDGDGTEEVVYTLSGHWNEIRVYDGQSQKMKWMHSFGPGSSSSKYMRGLVVTDLNHDGKKELVTGTEKGWLHVFSEKGDVVYSRKLPTAITAIAADESLQKVAFGLKDYPAVVLNADFSVKSLGVASTDAKVLQWVDTTLYVGGKGHVAEYTVH